MKILLLALFAISSAGTNAADLPLVCSTTNQLDQIISTSRHPIVHDTYPGLKYMINGTAQDFAQATIPMRLNKDRLGKALNRYRETLQYSYEKSLQESPSDQDITVVFEVKDGSLKPVSIANITKCRSAKTLMESLSSKLPSFKVPKDIEGTFEWTLYFRNMY